MANGTFIASVALHGALATAALVLAARAHREAPPREELFVIDLTPPPEPPAQPPPSLKSPENIPIPMAAPPPPRPPARGGAGTPKLGAGPAGNGLGVIAVEGDNGNANGDGFEMNAGPGDGDGKGNGATALAPSPPPPPPEPPPKPVAVKPREPTCDDLVTKPKPISRPRAIEYPDAARADGKAGRLLLQLVIAADGSVGQVDVIAGVHPALDAAAIAAVKTWRFEPASRCGKPIGGGTYRVARRFELGD